jgi:hypothetical protein
MTEQETPPPADSAPDRSGWSQPPAPAGAPLPPGAGSPVQPGPPMSVQAPIKDTTINLTALLLGAGIVIVIVIVLIVLIAAFGHRAAG